jgi:hypothetical protein
MVAVMLLAALGTLPSCGNQKVTNALTQAQVTMTSIESTFRTLITAANAMIPLLPEDQRAAKQQLLTDIQLRGDQLFQAESDAIAAAMAANAETFNVTDFASKIAVVMGDLIQFANTVKVRPDVVANAQARVALLKR